MDTEKKTFDDGSWWEFRTFLTHGTKNKMDAASRQFLTLVEPVAYDAQGNVRGDPKYDVDWSLWRPGPSNDAMLISSTIAWSYGEVDQETLDGIPDEYSDYVIRRMNELYAGPLVVTAQNGLQSDSLAI